MRRRTPFAAASSSASGCQILHCRQIGKVPSNNHAVVKRQITNDKSPSGDRKPPLRRSVCFSRLDPEFVIYSDSQFLFTAKVPFSCLYRNVPEQKLNLIQFAAGEMA